MLEYVAPADTMFAYDLNGHITPPTKQSFKQTKDKGVRCGATNVLPWHDIRNTTPLSLVCLNDVLVGLELCDHSDQMETLCCILNTVILSFFVEKCELAVILALLMALA